MTSAAGGLCPSPGQDLNPLTIVSRSVTSRTNERFYLTSVQKPHLPDTTTHYPRSHQTFQNFVHTEQYLLIAINAVSGLRLKPITQHQPTNMTTGWLL